MSLNEAAAPYWGKDNPLGVWVNSVLKPYGRFLTNYDMWYPERLKPRQPNELTKLIESLEKGINQDRIDDVGGILALKRDGWFLEIRITNTDKVHYMTYEGTEYYLDGLIDVTTLRQQLGGDLKNEEIIIHGEVYVMSQDCNFEAGCDVVRQALSEWRKNNARDWVRFSAFRLHTLGVIKGASLSDMVSELILLNKILKNQSPQISVIDFYAIKLDLSLNVNKFEKFRDFPDSVIMEKLKKLIDKQIRAPTQCNLKTFVEKAIEFADDNQYEGFILSLDRFPLATLFKERFKKDAFQTFRSQYQIKCKSLFEATLKVDPVTRIISDSQGRDCGVLEAGEVYHEKGFFQRLQPGNCVFLRCAWISVKKDLFTNKDTYHMSGIKYLRIKHIVPDPDDSLCVDIATICNKSKRWKSVQEQQERFLRETTNQLASIKRKRSKFVERLIEKISDCVLPKSMLHVNFSRSSKCEPCSRVKIWKQSTEDVEKGIVIRLNLHFPNEHERIVHGSEDVVIKLSFRAGVRTTSMTLLEWNLNSQNKSLWSPGEILGDECISKIEKQLQMSANPLVNNILKDLDVSFVARAYVDRDTKYNRKTLVTALTKPHKNSMIEELSPMSNTPLLKFEAYRLLKLSHITGFDLSAATQMKVLNHLLTGQKRVHVAKYETFEETPQGVKRGNSNTTWADVKTVNDLFDRLVRNNLDQDVWIRKDPPELSDQIAEDFDEELTDDEEGTESVSRQVKREQLASRIFQNHENLLEISTQQIRNSPSKEGEPAVPSGDGGAPGPTSGEDEQDVSIGKVSEQDMPSGGKGVPVHVERVIQNMKLNDFKKLVQVHKTDLVTPPYPTQGPQPDAPKKPTAALDQTDSRERSGSPVLSVQRHSHDSNLFSFRGIKDVIGRHKQQTENMSSPGPARIRRENAQSGLFFDNEEPPIPGHSQQAGAAQRQKRGTENSPFTAWKVRPRLPGAEKPQESPSPSKRTIPPPIPPTNVTVQDEIPDSQSSDDEVAGASVPERGKQPSVKTTEQPSPSKRAKFSFSETVHHTSPGAGAPGGASMELESPREPSLLESKRRLKFVENDSSVAVKKLNRFQLQDNFQKLIKHYDDSPFTTIKEIQQVAKGLTESDLDFILSNDSENPTKNKQKARLLFRICKYKPDTDLTQPVHWESMYLDKLKELINPPEWIDKVTQLLTDVKTAPNFVYDDTWKKWNETLQEKLIELGINYGLDKEHAEKVLERVNELNEHKESRENAHELFQHFDCLQWRDVEEETISLWLDFVIFLVIRGQWEGGSQPSSPLMLENEFDYYHSCCTILHDRIAWLERSLEKRLLISE